MSLKFSLGHALNSTIANTEVYLSAKSAKSAQLLDNQIVYPPLTNLVRKDNRPSPLLLGS